MACGKPSRFHTSNKTKTLPISIKTKNHPEIHQGGFSVFMAV
jgi:hypothetical protein